MSVTEADVQDESARIETLLGELRATGDAAVVGRVEELVERIVALYGAGVARVFAAVEDGRRRALADDPLVSALLLLHGLHPDASTQRVEEALARVRPYLGAHGGDVELAGIDEHGVARVKMKGACDGCASTQATVRGLVERAVREAAPELAGVEVDAPASAEGASRLVQIGRHP
jgi:Fe-S cluster biogenesis protein NfuA